MTFWSGDKLKRELPSLISEFSPHRVDCAAYTLRMGRQYYLSASDEDADTNKIEQLAIGECLAIPSGQFAVLLTEERVTVPPGKIAFISIKTGFKGRGLVNVSGFHVDPGYSAPLRFAVFNAGPSTICVKQGEECFLIWYADLDSKDIDNVKKEAQNRAYQNGIVSGDVAALSGAVKSVKILEKKIDDLEKTQIWMRVWLTILKVAAVLVIGLTVFFAREGIMHYIEKLGTGMSN